MTRGPVSLDMGQRVILPYLWDNSNWTLTVCHGRIFVGSVSVKIINNDYMLEVIIH